MTPEEIEKHFGAEALDILYDYLLDSPAHVLADWVLEVMSKEQIGDLVNDLKQDMED